MVSGSAPKAEKSVSAFRTIGELSAETGVAQHILRYWETRFPELRPLQRAGNRRYYRPEDVALVHRIDRLLNREGYTVRGVQQVLKRGPTEAAPVTPANAGAAAAMPSPPAAPVDRPGLERIRSMLADALAGDV